MKGVQKAYIEKKLLCSPGETLEELINNLMNTLLPREAKILMMRNGFCHDSDGGGQPWTLAKCGIHVNLTPEYVRQLERKALRKLRHPSCLEVMAEYGIAAAIDAIKGRQAAAEREREAQEQRIREKPIIDTRIVYTRRPIWCVLLGEEGSYRLEIPWVYRDSMAPITKETYDRWLAEAIAERKVCKQG